jgi:leucyl-tRNA synthetase
VQPKSYNPAEIEPKWQQYWEEHDSFRARRRAGAPKYYILDMFPYPSGSGLHVGHPEGYTATDILARYKRMKGFDVLHPMGWDAFGLPAEQHAIKTGIHPAINTKDNIDNFRKQLKSLGFSYDWSREVSTTDEAYVRWTQWIFLKLYHRGLAYQSEIAVNWCPELGTVLANEEVIDGKSEVGGHPVVRQPLRQWMLKITAYADRLLSDLEGLDWPETRVKQENWIGRSEGASIHFAVKDHNETIEVFTTRPDTVFGATYMVLAPEHPLVAKLTTDGQRAAVQSYLETVASKSDREREAKVQKKTGLFTGSYAINPFTEQPIPIWISDFVLSTYGTGAIMSVPAHDQRDFEFAREFGLPIVEVVSADGKEHDPSAWEKAFSEEGVAVRSGFLNGKTTTDAKQAAIAEIVARKLGEGKVNYRLRDWVFSRQRYWGEPIPIYFPVDLANGSQDPRKDPHTIRYDQPIAVEESELPLRLPELSDYRPGNDPAGSLARANDWRYFQKDGKWFARETNTMPQWAGSCWYYLRFLDPKNDEQPWSKAAYDEWMPVDLYMGGAEHAVLHLLYARFWHKVLFDEGYVSHPEPFQKLVHQGLILGEVEYSLFRTENKEWVDCTKVQENDSVEKGSSKYIDQDTRAPLEEVNLQKEEPNLVIKDGPWRKDEEYPDGDLVVVGKEGSNFFAEKIVAKQPVPGYRVQIRAQSHKMSKSRGNVVNPDEIIEKFGADALRVYEMFMGPLEQVKPWQTSGVIGVRRFLDRIWKQCAYAEKRDAMSNDSQRFLHKTIQKIGNDIEGLRFNTAVSALMILANHLQEQPFVNVQTAEIVALLLSPLAPHIAEEIWQSLGHNESLMTHEWPSFDLAMVVDDEITMPVQFNGKVRGHLTLPKDATEEKAKQLALAEEPLQMFFRDKTIRRFIYVPGKIMNFVVK